MSTEQNYDPTGSGASIDATPQAYSLLEPALEHLDLYPLSRPGKKSETILAYRALSAYKADVLHQLLLAHKKGVVTAGSQKAHELFDQLTQLEKMTSDLAEIMDTFGEAGQMAYQALRDELGYDKWELEQERILEDRVSKYCATYFNDPVK